MFRSQFFQALYAMSNMKLLVGILSLTFSLIIANGTIMTYAVADNINRLNENSHQT